jgi:hypothetical protein
MATVPTVLLAAAVPFHRRWTFGVNDTSAMGWLCAAAYLAATTLCLKARGGHTQGRHPNARILWLGAALCLAGLGLNKPLDLHDLAIQIVRDLSVAQGWYEQRRLFLGTFIVAAGAVGTALAVVLDRRFHPLSPELRLASAGLAALGGMLLLRGSPFPVVAKLLTAHLVTEEDGLFHIHLSEVLELLLLAIIARAAWRFIQHQAPSPADSSAETTSG